MVSMIGQGASVVLQFGSLAVLARLLTPEDFGLVGMAAVVIAFVAFFKDFGLTQATVQRKEIDAQNVSNLFWINLGLSAVIAFLLFALSPAIAAFYGKSELIKIIWVLAIGVLLEGAALQHRALMIRAMEFKKLVSIEVGSRFIGVVVAVTLANAGKGYWALVFMSLAGAFCHCLLFSISTGWLPSFPRNLSASRPYLKYGANLFGFNLLNFFSRNADNVIIGRFIGASGLGFYANAYKLLMFPVLQVNAPLSRVMLPSLSRLLQDDERFTAAYYASIKSILALTFPGLGLLLLCAPSVVHITLGPQWSESAVVFRLLAPAAFASALNMTTGWIFTSTGRTDRMLKWAIFAAPFTVLCMFLGVEYGIRGVAVAVSLSMASIRIPYLIYACKGTPIMFREVLKIISAVLVPTLLAVACSVAAFAVVSFEISEGWQRLLMQTVLYVGLFGILDTLINRRNGSIFSLITLKQWVVGK